MPRLILVGGGSSSGKSYVTDKVIKNVGEEKVTKITIDDYYKDQSNMSMEERVKVNYDHPKAFDWKLVRKQIQDLKDGKPIDKPIYDFTIHNRSPKVERIVPKELVIVEGIMALVDRQLREIAHLKVFISSSPEVRFLRRFIRDHTERKRSYESIVSQYLKTVAPMYKEIIEPSSNYADLIVNNDDGVANASIEVLTCVFKNELNMATDGKDHTYHANNEFTEELLNSVFDDSTKN